MSEPIPACIKIGGKLPPKLAPQLCAAITAEGVALEWGDASFRPQSAEDLLAAGQEHGGTVVLWLCDDQANWGRFETLEQFLVEHNIPFDRQADGKAEFNPDLVVFRPGLGPLCIVTNAERQPVVTAQSLDPVQQALAEAVSGGQRGDYARCLAELSTAQAALQNLLPPAIPPLPPFEVG